MDRLSDRNTTAHTGLNCQSALAANKTLLSQTMKCAHQSRERRLGQRRSVFQVALVQTDTMTARLWHTHAHTCTHTSTDLIGSLFPESLKWAAVFTREALPSQHGPAFQNSLLGNLEAGLKGKTTVGQYTVGHPLLPCIHTCTLNTKKGFHKPLWKALVKVFTADDIFSAWNNVLLVGV